MVSIIILNYNTPGLVLQCLLSIKQYVINLSYEIIVVDNCSSEENWQTLQQTLPPDVILVRAHYNYGFGAGNQLGAHYAKGEYLCFINSDVVFVEDCITPLILYAKQHPDTTGCMTPQQLNRNMQRVPSFDHKPGIIHEIIGKHPLERFLPKRYPKRKKIVYSSAFSVTMITGCFMFFPSAVFWEVGGFDLNIFLYYEEIDICTRLRRKGYKSIYYPQVSFQHSQGESTNKQPSLTTIERYISRLYCYKKHHTYGLYIIYYLINLVKLIFHPKRWFIFPFLLHGENMSHSMRHRKAMGKK